MRSRRRHSMRSRRHLPIQRAALPVFVARTARLTEVLPLRCIVAAGGLWIHGAEPEVVEAVLEQLDPDRICGTGHRRPARASLRQRANQGNGRCYDVEFTHAARDEARTPDTHGGSNE